MAKATKKPRKTKQATQEFTHTVNLAVAELSALHRWCVRTNREAEELNYHSAVEAMQRCMNYIVRRINALEGQP